MILFVCTANRYRSPIAAACFRQELQLHNMRGDWQVVSGGVCTMDGMPAASEAIRQAARMGADISRHTSHGITLQMMQAADLVLVMEKGHRQALSMDYPAYARKVHLLSEVATGTAYDIADPIASAPDETVPQELRELVHEGFDRICTLVR